jgi:transposase
MQTRSQTKAQQTKVQQTTPARTEHDIEKRALVIAFHKRGDSLRNVAKETNLSYSTVRNIIVKYKETGLLLNRPRCGRPTKLQSEDLEILKNSVLEDRESRCEPLSIITEKLNDTLSISISQTTVRRALKKVGIKCCSAVVKPFVSETNTAKRVEWCKERLHWTVEDWEKVCYEYFGLIGSFVSTNPQGLVAGNPGGLVYGLVR